jgi:hypothetical protein
MSPWRISCTGEAFESGRGGAFANSGRTSRSNRFLKLLFVGVIFLITGIWLTFDPTFRTSRSFDLKDIMPGFAAILVSCIILGFCFYQMWRAVQTIAPAQQKEKPPENAPPSEEVSNPSS